MSKRFMKVISMTLVAVLLINVLPVIAIEEVGGEYNDKVTSTENAPVQEDIINQEITVLGELDKKRSEYTKQYLLSDGTRVANVYADPVHYEKDGQWEEIDNTLVAKINGTYANTAGIWDVSFPQQLNKSKQITITKDGYTLSFGMAGRLDRASGAVTASIMAIGGTAEPYAVSAAQTTQAQIQQVDLSEAIAKVEHQEFVQSKLYSRLSYANVYANTDIVYDLQSNKVKESVILSQYDSTLRGYRYTLNTGELIPVLDETGHIEFYNAAMENIVMTMPAPFLVDANNVYNFDIQVQLAGSGGTYTLTYLLPQQWLASAERAYPVVLDPIVQAGTGVNNIADQTVFSIGSKSYTWIVVECGYDVNMGKERFFMAFTDLPELSASDVITSATVGLYKPYSSSTPFYVGVHSVLNTWSSSTITWANMPSTNAVVADYLNVTTPGWYYWDVTNIAKRWYNTGVNTGMMFKASDAVEAAAVNHWSQFYSSDNGAYSPTLTIEYQTITDLSVDDSYEVEISLVGQTEFFSFTPSVTGFYTFESSDNVGNPYVSLYNSSMELLAEDNDTAGDHNFRLTYHLIRGVKYRVTVGSVGVNGTFFTLNLYEPTAAIPLPATTITSGQNYTVSIENEYEQAFFKFTPTVTGDYLMYSSEAEEDTMLYLYDSDYLCLDDDDDGAGNASFRLERKLYAGQTYYLAATHYDSFIGTYTLNLLMVPSIPADVYYLRNMGTKLFMDIQNTSTQELAHHAAYSRESHERWTIAPQSDGYYTIRSTYGNLRYVGIAGTGTGADNIRLYDTVSDATKWRIYAKPTGELLIEPKNAPGKVLQSLNSTSLNGLRLQWMSTFSVNEIMWKLEAESSTPLIGQWTPEWCWAAAAQMFAAHYAVNDNDNKENEVYDRNQIDAVSIVKDTDAANWTPSSTDIEDPDNNYTSDGGSVNNAFLAISYYLTGSTESGRDLDLADGQGRTLTELALRNRLNEGHVVWIGLGKYSEAKARKGGHAIIIVGYTTVYINGIMEYRYIIYDPSPENPPDPWNNIDTGTTGQRKIVSYQWLRWGETTYSDTSYYVHWESIIVVGALNPGETCTPESLV